MGCKGGGKAGPEGSLTAGAGPPDSLPQVTVPSATRGLPARRTAVRLGASSSDHELC